MHSILFDLAEKFSQRLVFVRNFGLINYLRVYENFHGNMQLRLTDNPIVDIRVVNPWPELVEFTKQINFDELENVKHKHIPYIVILIQALEIFKNNVTK